VIRRRARERKSQRDIYRTAERRDLDGRHPDVVIRRDHGVKFPAHRSHKNCIRRKWPVNSGSSRCGLQKLGVFVAESPAITGVRIQGAQRNSRRLNPEPGLQPTACDARGFDDGGCAQILGDAAKRNVRRGKHYPELVRREHHRDVRSSQRCEHLRVTGKIVAASKQRGLIDRSGHNSVDGALLRHLDSSLDRQPAKHARQGRVRAGPPVADRLGDLHSGAFGANDYNVTALADPWVGERFGDNLRTNSAGIAHGHGKARFHCYIRSDT
jgi:hypothetical protein